jgi:hypothetical protein
MTYADPSEACQPIENVEGVSGEVVLIERGYFN